MAVTGVTVSSSQTPGEDLVERRELDAEDVAGGLRIQAVVMVENPQHGSGDRRVREQALQQTGKQQPQKQGPGYHPGGSTQDARGPARKIAAREGNGPGQVQHGIVQGRRSGGRTEPGLHRLDDVSGVDGLLQARAPEQNVRIEQMNQQR